jgi:predicted lipid-binding transport protein (Tim44 family)
MLGRSMASLPLFLAQAGSGSGGFGGGGGGGGGSFGGGGSGSGEGDRTASAEAAEDDAYFASDELERHAVALFRAAQMAWDARDRAALGRLVGPDRTTPPGES